VFPGHPLDKILSHFSIGHLHFLALNYYYKCLLAASLFLPSAEDKTIFLCLGIWSLPIKNKKKTKLHSLLLLFFLFLNDLPVTTQLNQVCSPWKSFFVFSSLTVFTLFWNCFSVPPDLFTHGKLDSGRILNLRITEMDWPENTKMVIIFYLSRIWIAKCEENKEDFIRK
jgi:energy-converting hydrogenase Eha subunit C